MLCDPHWITLGQILVCEQVANVVTKRKMAGIPEKKTQPLIVILWIPVSCLLSRG